jgi:hypothetical protein
MNATATQPRLKARYNNTIKAQLAKDLGIDNEMQIPKLEKIVINMGVGRATQQPSLLEKAVDDLTVIAGQKPIITRAGNSIAGFKLREGQAIGTKVTLRGDRMWEFYDRLLSVAIPRIRDFRGLPAQLVGRPWQLHVRPQRPDRVPRDRRRQDRRPARDGHHDRHDGHHERGRQGAARCVRVPVQEGRRRRDGPPQAQAEPPRPAWSGQVRQEEVNE